MAPSSLTPTARPGITVTHGTLGARGGDDDDGDWREALRGLMIQPATSPLPPVAEFARQARPHVSPVAKTVSEQVTNAIDLYADREGHGRQLVEDAITAALHEFLDLFDGMPHRDRAVGRQFRSLGQRHASRHEDIAGLYGALLVAGTHLPSALVAHGGPSVDDPAILGRLSAAGHRYLSHLTSEVAAGFQAARRRFSSDLNRRRIAEQLLAGQFPGQHEAGSDVDEVPDQITVAVVDTSDGPSAELPDSLSGALSIRRAHQLVVMVDSVDRETAIQALTESTPPQARVAFSWSVRPGGVAAAHRWARRALSLARRGIIADEPLLNCAEHRTQIWLHAEPELRQGLAQDLLAPLLAETPNSREILSETLLAWLESRDSAPAIAARLGVHAQTVRYRWKRINELFGEALHDPEFVVQITMLLKASVPLWKSGDQRDFELFHSEGVR